MFLANLKKLLSQNKAWEGRINKEKSEMLNIRQDIWKSWGDALNKLIDENRSEDGYTYMYIPERNCYVMAKNAECYATPLVSGGVTLSLATSCKINGFVIYPERSSILAWAFNDYVSINIENDIEIIEQNDFVEIFNGLKNVLFENTEENINRQKKTNQIDFMRILNSEYEKLFSVKEKTFFYRNFYDTFFNNNIF